MWRGAERGGGGGAERRWRRGVRPACEVVVVGAGGASAAVDVDVETLERGPDHLWGDGGEVLASQFVRHLPFPTVSGDLDLLGFGDASNLPDEKLERFWFEHVDRSFLHERDVEVVLENALGVLGAQVLAHVEKAPEVHVPGPEVVRHDVDENALVSAPSKDRGRTVASFMARDSRDLLIESHVEWEGRTRSSARRSGRTIGVSRL